MRAWLMLLLLIPAATASIDNPDGDYEAKLYLHVNDRQEIQLNPLAPPSDFQQDAQSGGLTQSGCADTPGQRLTSQQQHTWYAVVAAAPVRYQRSSGPDSLLERGIRDDLQLVDRPMSLDWYVRAQTAPGQEGVAPRVVLEATLREGDDISVGEAAMNAGRIIGAVRTAPADLHPQLEGHPDVTYDESAGVYHFHVEMAPRSPLSVPRSESFNLRLDMFTENPYCDSPEGYTMPDLVSVVSLPSHRPLLTMAIRNPVTIDRVSAVVEDDLVRLEADARAVFGASDAILRRDAFSIDGPGQAQTVAGTSWGEGLEDNGRAFPARADRGFQGHEAWAFRVDGAGGGLFNATLTIRTESGAVATATVPFGLGAERTTCTVLATGGPSCSMDPVGGQSTPAPLLLLGLVAALALRRR